MKSVKQILLLASCLFGITASAQFGMGGMAMQFSKCKIVSGDPKVLKGKTIKVTFVYDGTRVGKYKDENDYIEKKRTAYNEKEPGRGDTWAAAWKADRKNRFEPAFFTKWNEMGKETGTLASADKGEYNLEVKTLYTDPGFNIGITREPATINTTCTFTDAAGKEVAVITVNNVPGQEFGGFDFDTGTRLSECYEKCAKDLYKTIAKKF
ncbi:MAG: hypothetical protein U0T73_13945 [Chitinophagales bacterium]